MRRFMAVMASLSVLLLFGACASAPSVEMDSAGRGRLALEQEMRFPEQDFLVAEGTGRSESEAEDRALAELSRNFEARVESESIDTMTSTFESGLGGDTERFAQEIREEVRVSTKFVFQGARTSEPWQDPTDGSWHVLAALNRRNAGDRWQGELAKIDSQIEVEDAASENGGSGLARFRAFRRLQGLHVKRSVLATRLRVIGIEPPVSGSDAARIWAEAARLRGELVLTVRASGDEASLFESELSEALSRAGFRLATGAGEAVVAVEADVTVKEIAVDNPGWIFVRAEARVRLIDQILDEETGHVRRDARAARVDYDEASRAAVLDLAEKVTEGFGELVK